MPVTHGWLDTVQPSHSQQASINLTSSDWKASLASAIRVSEDGDGDDGGWQQWRPPQHALYHVAHALLLVSFLIPITRTSLGFMHLALVVGTKFNCINIRFVFVMYSNNLGLRYLTPKDKYPVIKKYVRLRLSTHADPTSRAFLKEILSLHIERRRREDRGAGGAEGGGAWGGGIPLPIRLGGLRERRELPQRGLGRNPSRF